MSSALCSVGRHHASDDHDKEHEDDRDDDGQRGRQRWGRGDRRRDRGARLRRHLDRRDEDADGVRAVDASAKCRIPHACEMNAWARVSMYQGGYEGVKRRAHGERACVFVRSS